jgi:hypothetical protein
LENLHLKNKFLFFENIPLHHKSRLGEVEIYVQIGENEFVALDVFLNLLHEFQFHLSQQ